MKKEVNMKEKKKNDESNTLPSYEKIQDRFLRIKESQKKMEKQFEQYCRENNFTKETFDLVQDSKNFSESDWNKIQKIKAKISEILGEDLSHLLQKKAEKDLSSKKKRKLLGSRKKWIQMR